MIAPNFCISAIDGSQLAGENSDRASKETGLLASLARAGKRLVELLGGHPG